MLQHSKLGACDAQFCLGSSGKEQEFGWAVRVSRRKKCKILYELTDNNLTADTDGRS